MNILSILKLVQKALGQYRKLYKGSKINRRFVRYNLRTKKTFGYLKGVSKQALGGYDIWGGFKSPKTKTKQPKEYAVMKIWKSMSEGQKKQFREWFRNKAMSQSRVARSFTFEHELRKAKSRVVRISNKYFVERKKLTNSEKEFVYNFSEFFGDVDSTQKKVIGWYYPKSSWIISFRYQGQSGKDKKGILFVNMKRGTMTYPFPNFPYIEYVMLKNVTGSVGKYWWKKWLWRYSTNPNRYKKYWYKGRPRYGK